MGYLSSSPHHSLLTTPESPGQACPGLFRSTPPLLRVSAPSWFFPFLNRRSSAPIGGFNFLRLRHFCSLCLRAFVVFLFLNQRSSASIRGPVFLDFVSHSPLTTSATKILCEINYFPRFLHRYMRVTSKFPKKQVNTLDVYRVEAKSFYPAKRSDLSPIAGGTLFDNSTSRIGEKQNSPTGSVNRSPRGVRRKAWGRGIDRANRAKRPGLQVQQRGSSYSGDRVTSSLNRWPRCS